MALSVRDGKVWLAWCGEASERFEYLSIEYRELPAGGPFVTAFEGTGEFYLEPNLEFAALDGPPGVEVRVVEQFPADQLLRIFINPGQSQSELASWAVIFETPPLDELSSGTWIHPSGQVQASPAMAWLSHSSLRMFVLSRTD